MEEETINNDVNQSEEMTTHDFKNFIAKTSNET